MKELEDHDVKKNTGKFYGRWNKQEKAFAYKQEAAEVTDNEHRGKDRKMSRVLWTSEEKVCTFGRRKSNKPCSDRETY